METKDIDPKAKAKERAMAMAKATDLRVITVVIGSSVELSTLLVSALFVVSSATNAMEKKTFWPSMSFSGQVTEL